MEILVYHAAVSATSGKFDVFFKDLSFRSKGDYWLNGIFYLNISSDFPIILDDLFSEICPVYKVITAY